MTLKCVTLVECFQVASALHRTSTMTVHGEIRTLQNNESSLLSRCFLVLENSRLLLEGLQTLVVFPLVKSVFEDEE
jgi:hypothetical protein